MCKVIAITNQKGGCAKTNVTVNLGIGLVREAMQSEEVAAYMSASRAVIKQAMTEACQLAAFIYHECFVFGMSAEELKTNFSGYEDYIDVTVGYIHQLFDKSKIN